MHETPQRTRNAGRWRAFDRICRKTHRWIAIALGIPCAFMAVSGLWLSHQAALGNRPLWRHLHAAQYLDAYASVVLDVLAVSWLVLTTTGIVMWLRSRGNREASGERPSPPEGGL